MTNNRTTGIVTQGPPTTQLVIIPWEAYKPQKKQFSVNFKQTTYFAADGCLGAPLSIVSCNASAQQPRLDDPGTPLFEDCGTKVTFVIHFSGYKAFKLQKYSSSRHHGKPVAHNRQKVLKQVAEVMEAFLQSIRHDRYNELFSQNGGIRLEELYLLELRHVAKASFQPIFAVDAKHHRAGSTWIQSTPPKPPPSVATDEDMPQESMITVNSDYDYPLIFTTKVDPSSCDYNFPATYFPNDQMYY